MNGLSTGAVEHIFPVVEIIVLLALGFGGIVTALWRGFVWLDKRIDGRFNGLTETKAFKVMVTGIVNEAAAGWADVNNRLHNEHSMKIVGLERRDEERADAIKRLHGRVDEAWVEISKVNARVSSGR